MRLIDADAFRKRIDRYPPEIRDNAKKELRYVSTIEPISVNHWIPVTKRLPDQAGEYLVTWEFDDHRSVIVAWYARMYHNSNRCFHYVNDDGDEVSIEDEVLAWMPLPEPYEEVVE